MPVWLAIFAHFLLPGEQLTPARALGLALALVGVTWAVLERDPVTEADIGRCLGHYCGTVIGGDCVDGAFVTLA